MCTSILLAAGSLAHVEGFAGPNSFERHHHATHRQRHNYNQRNNINKQQRLNMYVQPNQPTSQTAPMVAKAIFSSHNTGSNKRKNTSLFPLSNSVLSSSDTLPSFPTAHGLLSPETVLRMEEMMVGKNDAVDYFLKTYRNHGPMACLPLLSDPKVLPSLTEAMRDVIA